MKIKCKRCNILTTNKKYCSNECRTKYATELSIEIRICEWCKNEFSELKRKPNRFCGEKCRRLYQATPDAIKYRIQKAEEACLKKYGKTHAPLTEQSRIKMLERYSDTEWVKKSVDKMKNTKLEKYGNANWVNVEKYRQTMTEKYGVINYSQTPMFRKNNFNRVKNRVESKNLIILETESTYINVKHEISFKCIICDYVFTGHAANGLTPKCPRCIEKSSTAEKEIVEFINSIYNGKINGNIRSIISPKEIDIYLPDLKLGIEFDGIYWHSELHGKKSKSYHLNKTQSCNKKDVRLIHIFENEWTNKQEIVKSIIQNAITSSPIKMYGRDTEIKSISTKECNEFLDQNHLQGKDRSSVRYGLYTKENLLVSVMTFSKSRYDKSYQWELLRYVSKINHTIVGGASKLMAYFVNVNNPTNVVTYSDLRYFSGNIYKSLGFKFHNVTPPNYHYFKYSSYGLLSRHQFQKHKLKNVLETFDPELSEWENMKLNGFDRIWDCGHSKWTWSK